MLSYRNQPVTQALQAHKQQHGTGEQAAYRYRSWSAPTGAVPGVEAMPPAHGVIYDDSSNIRKRAPVLTLEGCGCAGSPVTRDDRTGMQAVPGTDEVPSPSAKPVPGKMQDSLQDGTDARQQDQKKDTERQAAMQSLYRQKTIQRQRGLIPMLGETGGAVRKLFMEACYDIRNEYRLREKAEKAPEAVPKSVPQAAPPASLHTDNAETLSCSFSPRF